MCEVFQKEGAWFAAFVVERPEVVPQTEGRIQAIDLGVYNIAACVDETGRGVLYSGRGLLAIQHYFNKQFAKVQQRLNKRERKTSAGLRALYRKRGTQISQNLHKITTHLIASAVDQGITTLVVRDLTHIRNQMRFGPKTNQKLHTWAFKQIITQLTYKGKQYGISVVQISERNTSKTCSHCGQVRPANRVARGRYQCRACSWTMNADLNGATNILNKYLQAQGHPGQVVLAPLAVPVVRLVEPRKCSAPTAECPRTAIRPAMVESPRLQ